MHGIRMFHRFDGRNCSSLTSFILLKT
jgi:hypothetical protein